MFVRFCRVKKACTGDGGEVERALDDVFGIWAGRKNSSGTGLGLCLEIRIKPTRPVQLCSRFVFNTVMFIFP